MATARQKDAARRNLAKARSARRRGGRAPHSPGLSAAERDHLLAQGFAFPKERKEPLADERHVRNAVARLDLLEGMSDRERDLAWKRIQRAAERFGVELRAEHWRELGGGRR